MQFYNRGIKAHLLAAQHLIDDDHFVFTNFCGIGPIDLVRLNIQSGKTELFDQSGRKSGRTSYLMNLSAAAAVK